MKAPSRARSLPAAVAMAAFGWLVPGGGYLLMRRYGRFAINLVLVSAAFGAGVLLHGGNLWPQPQELVGLDGLSILLAQAATVVKLLAGGPYLLARLFDYSQSFVGSRLHEYGTVLLVMAGLINLLAVIDAIESRKLEQS